MALLKGRRGEAVRLAAARPAGVYQTAAPRFNDTGGVDRSRRRATDAGRVRYSRFGTRPMRSATHADGVRRPSRTS